MSHKSMSFIAIATASLAAFVASTAPAAAASTNEKIQLCRTALEAREDMNIEEYRLRLKSSKGGRVTKLKMQAIPTGNGERFEVLCVLKKDEVTSIDVKDI